MAQPWLKQIEGELHQWMDTCKITSLKEACGVLSHRQVDNLGAVEREEYRKALLGYSMIDVPSWHDEVPIHVDAHVKV